MDLKFLIIFILVLSSCGNEEFQLNKSIHLPKSLVYLNGQLGNYVNSSYSVITSDDSSLFYLQFAETKENFSHTTAIAGRINNIPISNSYYIPVNFNISNENSIYVRLGQAIEWDLPGPNYKYASGLKDYIYFEQVDTVDHIILVKGKLTFKRISAYPQAHGSIPLVFDFVIYDYYTAR